MPDVNRSDSQRSDASFKPRVSFNRDVHVKRIVTREAPHVTSALSGDGSGHLVALPLQREHFAGRSQKDLAEEAAKVLQQVDEIDSATGKRILLPDKFYTLPGRRRLRRRNYDASHSSQEHVNISRKPDENLNIEISSLPRKTTRNSVFNLFKKSEKESKPKHLVRSVSDASNLKSKPPQKQRKYSSSDSEEPRNHLKNKAPQLSPIIEVSAPREDYFSIKKDYFSNKENEHEEKDVPQDPELVTRKKWKSTSNKRNETNSHDVFSESLNRKNKIDIKNNPAPNVIPEVIVIDVDKAENITDSKQNKKKKTESIKSKLKSISLNKDKRIKKYTKVRSNPVKPFQKRKEKEEEGSNCNNIAVEEAETKHLDETVDTFTDNSSEMIHSSQQPVEKLPLTRGYKIDKMIKRLSKDKSPPPPKTNILITPSATIAHNNNQPFSYTQPRANSPEVLHTQRRSPLSSNQVSSPIIYAQVVVGNGDTSRSSNKQTIHTVYSNKKHVFHSDSDEGLGYEENSGFGKKYEHEKTFTHFGDEKYPNGKYDPSRDEEDYPITPKFKLLQDYQYSNYPKSKNTIYIDSSARGRGDGMDSKRRDSLTEPNMKDEFNIRIKKKNISKNSRSDLSYRRDLLESRINSRRLGDKHTTINKSSPEISPKRYSPSVNRYITETSRYYRHGSSSPVGFTDKRIIETKVDSSGAKSSTDNRSKQYLEFTTNNPHFTDYDSDRRSGHVQSDNNHSSPENIRERKTHYVTRQTNSRNVRTLHSNKYKTKSENAIVENQDRYKSNPEIHRTNYDPNNKYQGHKSFVSETYHDSLRRQKHEYRNNLTKHDERTYDDETERKDKFGDSGIENDFKRDSGDAYILNKNFSQMYRSSNESEDEGFVSSLLIASERQHTEDNFEYVNKMNNKEYDSDKDNSNTLKPNMDYKHQNKQSKHEYVHRERCIDDGSHYDPRIDKDLNHNKEDVETLRKNDKKPPKSAKKNSLVKMKQLFSRDTSKKVKKEEFPEMVREESLRARYKEYTGHSNGLHKHSNGNQSTDFLKETNVIKSEKYDYNSGRRLSTPSPSPPRDKNISNQKEKSNSGSWFKSLDRLSRKKSEKVQHDSAKGETPRVASNAAAKSLRFFGDTDVESNDNVQHKPAQNLAPSQQNFRHSTPVKNKSLSTRDLHNISEEFDNSDSDTLHKKANFQSMQNVTQTNWDNKDIKLSMKPPVSPKYKTNTLKSENRIRRKKNDVNSVESSTEGESQQSQRSVLYLHAATVGDIPDPGYLAKTGKRTASKEELASNESPRMHTHMKTISRSFSVLAPWKPKHAHERYNIDYSQDTTRMDTNGKPHFSRNPGKFTTETPNQKNTSDNRKSSQNLSTLSRKPKSKENITSTLNRKKMDDSQRSSNSTLFKKKEKQTKENPRYVRDDKKMTSKSMSVESLSGTKSLSKKKDENKMLARSVSMPRDPERSAGWFKLNKKNKKTSSTQRL